MNNLIFKSRDELIQVNPADIVYFKADSNDCKMMLVTRKVQLLPMNLTKMQLLLDDQLGSDASLFERVGREFIIRKAFIYSIQTLKQKLQLALPNSDQYFELKVSKEALRVLKKSHEVKPAVISTLAQLRDLQTRKVYALKTGQNRFGRKSNKSECEHQIDNGDSQISRMHFEIDVRENNITNCYGYYLTDCQSANGTSLNERLIVKNDAILLDYGNIIKAGKTELMLEDSDIDKTEISI